MISEKTAVILIIVTVVYVVVMGILFWRYRMSVRELSEQMRQRNEAKEQPAEQEESDELFVRLSEQRTEERDSEEGK
ncbi:MAG: hypothetical protein LUC50_05195 [Ruminococcus sp.]|nr:hypothetical protein [Ruminococcus sp.]